MAQPWLPRTVPLTVADRVDVNALATFLRDAGVDTNGVDLKVSRFPGGHSNLTYLVQAGPRRLVIRAPPPGAHTVSGHDMVREHRLLQALRPHYHKVPSTIAVCIDAATSPLGTPFYAMEAVAGRVLRHKVPDDVTLDPETMTRLSTALVDELAVLHGVDVTGAGLADLGRPEGYVQRQVDGWCARYDKARTDDVSDIDAIMTWLKHHVPGRSSGPPTVVHNDFKLDNLVLADDDVTRIRAVLDWELCTIGEPLTDLGTTLAYWVQGDDDDSVKSLPMGLTWLPGTLSRLEVVRRWEERTGRSAHDVLFYYVLASFKVAVIAQQIHARYVRGFTTDERFALLGLAVAIIGARTCRALDAGRIDVA